MLRNERLIDPAASQRHAIGNRSDHAGEILLNDVGHAG
jgi:hypothetical protein